MCLHQYSSSVYLPTLQLWFATGDFFISRFMSKALVRGSIRVLLSLCSSLYQALQLKAIQLGLLEHDGRRPSVKDKEQVSKL